MKTETSHDDHEILHSMMTEWVAAVYPSIAEFSRAEKALEHFKSLLEKDNG